METAKGGPGEPDKVGRSEGRELLSRPYTSPIAARELALTEDCWLYSVVCSWLPKLLFRS